MQDLRNEEIGNINGVSIAHHRQYFWMARVCLSDRSPLKTQVGFEVWVDRQPSEEESSTENPGYQTLLSTVRNLNVSRPRKEKGKRG